MPQEYHPETRNENGQVVEIRAYALREELTRLAEKAGHNAPVWATISGVNGHTFSVNRVEVEEDATLDGLNAIRLIIHSEDYE